MKKIESKEFTPDNGVSQHNKIQQTTGPIILMTLVGNTGQQFDNFAKSNCKDVYIWGTKIAWNFFKVNINQAYGSHLGSKNFPSYFYIRTESWNIYKIIRKDYGHLQEMCKMGTCEHIINTFPTDRCIYNPQTKTVTGVENFTVKCWEQFDYAPQCNTSKIKEIVGVSTTQWWTLDASLKSTIEQDFIKKMK